MGRVSGGSPGPHQGLLARKDTVLQGTAPWLPNLSLQMSEEQREAVRERGMSTSVRPPASQKARTKIHASRSRRLGCLLAVAGCGVRSKVKKCFVSHPLVVTNVVRGRQHVCF